MSTTHGGSFTLFSFIAERQAEKVQMPVFIVLGLIQPGIESKSAIRVVDILFSQPLIF